jgi:hypothetical protein
MAGTKLPEHWPPRYNDYSVLEQRRVPFEDEYDEIIRPLMAVLNKPVSESEIDVAIARAQSAVLVQYRMAADAIGGLLRLDASITAADRALRYPDGAMVFDQALLPAYWLIGRMRQRITLPAIEVAMAAE